MPNTLRTLIFLILLLAIPTLAHGQDSDARLKEIDSYAAKALTDWRVPGMAIAIVKDDRIIFAKGYGVRKLGEATPDPRG
jgi:CubicO group peptidase (beta-lactamase class C family)